MNIIDAVKSGKIIRRKGFGNWVNINAAAGICFLSWKEIVADDWEIEEEDEEIKIRKSKAEAVIAHALAEAYAGNLLLTDIKKKCVKIMGFKE